MKKLFVNPKGKILCKDVRDPIIEYEGLVVKTAFSLISAGTELVTIQTAKSMNFSFLGILNNILKSKEFRKRIFIEIKKRNLKDILYVYKTLLKSGNDKNFKSSTSNLKSLGYSSSGIVQMSNIEGYEINNRVACAGSNHAELIYSPKNLSCKIPDNVSLKEAAFVSLGAVALHAIHRADIKLGEYVGIIGCGLIGLITIQLAKVSGAIIFAIDLINTRLNLAKSLGADFILNPHFHKLIIKVNENTKGRGLDSIIICASSRNSKPLDDAIDLIRNNGRIVLVGAFPINIDRSKLYYKEADLLISRSYGPGRYDKYYEYEGIDYPEKYVMWTEHRNMNLFLKLISEKKIDVNPLISDIISFEKANEAYKKLQIDPINNIAILLQFSAEKDIPIDIKKKEVKEIKPLQKKLIVGLIGCGSFAQENHLPFLLANPKCKIKAICTEHQKTANLCEEKYRPEYVTTNYKKILEDSEIKTVFIYTRHDTHGKYTIEALKAGKNVYVEKPMAITKDQCYDVYKTVKELKKLYTIGFNRRYSPLIQTIKNILKDKTNPIIINYRIANEFIPGQHWLFDPNIGGGPFIGELCHFTDLILYLMNSEPIELIAKGGFMSHKNLNTYDTCSVIIKFQNGSIGNIIYTDLNGPTIPKERIEIFSGESAIIIDDFIKMNTIGFDIGNKILHEQDKGHKNELISVINANLGKENLLVNVDDALKAMDLCFKIIESIEFDKVIKINSDLYERISVEQSNQTNESI